MDSIKCPIVKSDSVCYWKDMWQKLDRMRQLWQLCDVSLVTLDNRMFMAHSPVLAASSNTLHDILIRLNQAGTGEETQKKVFLQNVTSDVLEVTLNFIYGITPISRLAFERLQVGAKELGILGAYEYCCNQLKKLSVEASGSADEGKSLTTTMRLDSQEENLISCQWQLDEPSGLNGDEGPKHKFALDVSQSTYQVSHAEMGVDAAGHGVNSIVCWPVDEPVADDKTIGNPADNAIASSCSSPSNADDCQPSILSAMPSDDIHTAMFTQMSLVDLTAGVKCPHIKGIIGEHNPMDSFLVENELIDETFKNSLQADESDFDETPTLEEQSIDFSVRVPLKKRKRSSSVQILDGDGEAESTDQSFVQIKSIEVNNLAEGSDFQNFLERNASISSKDSSSDNCNLNLMSCFVSSNSLKSCSSSDPIQATLQGSVAKTLTLISPDERAFLKIQNVPTLQSDSIECIQSVCNSDKLQRENQSMNLESLNDCRSSFQSFISSRSQCFQEQNIQTDSICSIPRNDFPPNHFLFSMNNSLLSPGMVSGSSDNLLVSKSSNSSRSLLSINQSRAPSIGNSHSIGSQVLDSVWQDGFTSLEPCFTASNVNVLNAAKILNWESVSILEPLGGKTLKLNQELASNLESATGLDVTPSFEQKIFTSLNSILPKHVVSSSKDMDSALPMHEKQVLCFSTLGPCQGIAPNTMSRSQPNDRCPSVADVSIPASIFQPSDEIFPKESLHNDATNYIQEGYISSSPEPNEQPLNGKCQCEHCDKVFKNRSQLNGHKKRIHLQKNTEPSSTDATHKCQYCQESFRSSYKLQTHQLKVHSKGKLFSCQDCSFRSPRKKDVQAHMLSQHGRAPFGVKVYSCSSCNYKCIDRNRFEEHEAKHTGITSHRCPLCSRAYTTKRGMRTHIKYHSEERPHKCNICGAAFKVTSKLSDHMKLIHIQKGVKPYKCGYCDHATALRGNCNQHIRKNHPGQPLFIIDKFASQRKCVKDYDYAGISGEGIEEDHGDCKAVKVGIQSSKMVTL